MAPNLWRIDAQDERNAFPEQLHILTVAFHRDPSTANKDAQNMDWAIMLAISPLGVLDATYISNINKTSTLKPCS